MNRKNFFEKLGKMFNVKVVFLEEESFSVKSNFSVSAKTGKIIEITNEKIIVPKTSILSDAKNYFIDCLCDNFKKTAINYHPELVSFLHEIGHINTLVGIDYFWHKNKISEIEQSTACIHLYRELPREKLADAWAIKWLKNNPVLAKRLSNELYKIK